MTDSATQQHLRMDACPPRAGLRLLRPAASRTRLVLLFMAVSIHSACVDERLPTAPGEAMENPGTTPPAEPTHGGSLLKARARILDPARLTLTSTSAQLEAGQYRFIVKGDAVEAIGRDDVIVVHVGDEVIPRVVLAAEHSAGDLVIETGPAFWSDVFNSGRFGIHGALGGALSVIGDLPDPNASETIDIEPIGGTFDIDVCELAGNVLFEPICGSSISKTVGWVTIDGTLDSLALQDMDIRVSGTVAIDFAVDGGGVYGGTPPVFAPCNRGAYPGCTSTPTGAAFIEFLRTYAPTIPEASLPPVRVCIPGRPIRVRRGYWVYPGFPNPPRWVRPVYETCRVSSTGELPAIVPPSVRSARAVVQPRVQGGTTVYADGDVKLRVQVPIPNVAVRKTVDKSGVFAEVSLGIFVALDLTLKNTGVAPRLTFDEEVRITQLWSPADGWSSDFQSVRSAQNVSLEELVNPDSVVVRVSMPIEVKSKIELKGLAVATGGGTPTDTTDLLGMHAGFTYAPFAETIWSRRQIHPDDAALDNWQLSTDLGYQVNVGAGLDFPDIIETPDDLKTSWDTIFEFGRVSLADMWGRGNLRVETTTTGADPDPDGYEVLVSRHDPAQLTLDGGAERIPKYDPAAFIQKSIDSNGTVVFGKGVGPCTVVYSEGALKGVAMLLAPPPPPTPPSPRTAVSLPKFALVYNCDELLIARHIVTLSGVAENCTVTGGPIRSEVWLRQSKRELDVTRSDTTVVRFDVTCTPASPMGAIAVHSGVPISTGVPLWMDGESLGLLHRDETLLVAGLTPGERTLRLGAIENCDVQPVTVNVVANDTAEITVGPVACRAFDLPPDAIEVRVTADPDGVPAHDLVVKRDGVIAGLVSPAQPIIIENVPELGTTVLLLTAPDSNCRATDSNPRALTGGGIAVFGMHCISAQIDTLLGAVDAAPFPVATAHLTTVDGTRVQLTGPSLADFVALAGTTVRVWGVRAGTSFDVYGYDVLSELNEPRHAGIIVERDGGLWLMGESAIELIDPPPGLAAAVGAFVWAGGVEVGVGSLRVTVFGVIRESGS